jgi:cell division protein FtsZ
VSDLFAINTDAQQLIMSDADVKLDIRRKSTRGLGAGASSRWDSRRLSTILEEIRERYFIC